MSIEKIQPLGHKQSIGLQSFGGAPSLLNLLVKLLCDIPVGNLSCHIGDRLLLCDIPVGNLSCDIEDSKLCDIPVGNLSCHIEDSKLLCVFVCNKLSHDIPDSTQ